MNSNLVGYIYATVVICHIYVVLESNSTHLPKVQGCSLNVNIITEPETQTQFTSKSSWQETSKEEATTATTTSSKRNRVVLLLLRRHSDETTT